MTVRKLDLDRVDILVHTYNNENAIEKCINSIINQTHQKIFVTIVDDCSTDGTWIKVNELRDRFPQKITIKKTSKNYGSATQARKECVFTPKGGFWGMIDGDDWWIATDKVELQLIILNQNKNYVGCSGGTIIKDLDGITIGHIKPSKEVWNYLDYVLGVNNLYVHVSSILWKNIFHGSDGFRPKLAQKKWPLGEWPLTLAALAESRLSICHLEENVSQYNFNGQGTWSRLSDEERQNKNQKLCKDLSSVTPYIYKLAKYAKQKNLNCLFNILGVENR